jgi:serine/threonine protein kinase
MPHNLEHLLSHHHSASEFRAAKWGLQIARGIDYLHSHGICYQNICPGTVWLNGALHCKLGNFSYAAIYYDVTKGQFVNVGKCHNKEAEYHPPEESFFSSNYDPVKADVWMWAATVVYILCKKFPSKNILGVQDFTNFRNAHIAILSDDGRDLLATCLNKDPGQRPTMSAVLHDIWFKEFIQPHNHQAQQVGSVTQVVTTLSGHVAVIHHDAESSGSVVSPTSTDSSGSVSS